MQFLFTFLIADPLTFAQSRSALCFLAFVLLFSRVHAQRALRSSILNVLYAVTLLERKIHGPISEHACFHFPICRAP